MELLKNALYDIKAKELSIIVEAAKEGVINMGWAIWIIMVLLIICFSKKLMHLSPLIYIGMYLGVWIAFAFVFSLWLREEFYYSSLKYEDFFKRSQSRLLQQLYNEIIQNNANQNLLYDNDGVYQLLLPDDCKIAFLEEDIEENMFSEQEKPLIRFTLSCTPTLTQDILDRIGELTTEVNRKNNEIASWYWFQPFLNIDGRLRYPCEIADPLRLDPLCDPFYLSRLSLFSNLPLDYPSEYDTEAERQKLYDSLAEEQQQLHELEKIRDDWWKMAEENKQANVFSISLYSTHNYQKKEKQNIETTLKIKERAILFGFPQTYDVFPLTLNGKTSITFTQDFYEDLEFYTLTRKGIPAGNLCDHFIRMLYLSTVTITTLGYGDIVPTSNLSRAWITLESIVGVIIIGLFLNSIARPEKYAKQY